MLPPEIIAKVPSSYESGLASRDLFFFASTVTIHPEAGVDFEIRLCPALQRKPELPTPHFDDASSTEASKPLDPFAPPYNSGLFVGSLQGEEQDDEYIVLMNKYCVVPRHFLLVTKEFQSQSSPLMPNDLTQAYALLVAARKASKNIFAFYNCGDLSGASQPHKHLQFIEVDNEDGPPIETLARSVTLETPNRPFAINRLPYANHVIRFNSRLPSSPSQETESTLAQAFLSLLDLAVSTIRHDPDYPAGKPSYNVILTLEHMHLIPRRYETHTLTATGEAISVNALGFAGMLLVKSDVELAAVEKEGVCSVLRAVGLESVHDLQVTGVTNDIDGDEGAHL